MSSRSSSQRRNQPEPANLGQGVLQAIFAVFLGLMITAFVGVGVYTFYPNPADETRDQVSTLYERQATILQCESKVTGCRSESELSASERAELRDINNQINVLERTSRSGEQAWAQRTSVILVVLATLLMAISLMLGQSVSVISNGVLLGGLFTMLYAVGWGLASGNSVGRFLVLSAALAISLTLGYLRFVRGRGGPEAAATTGIPPGGGPDQLVPAQVEARLSDLERRLAAAGSWLAGGTVPVVRAETSGAGAPAPTGPGVPDGRSPQEPAGPVTPGGSNQPVGGTAVPDEPGRPAVPR